MPVHATTSTISDYLVSGFWNDGGRVGAHSFNTAGTTTVTINLQGLTPAAQAMARAACDAWEGVADIRLREVTSGARITFDDRSSGAGTSAIVDGSRTVSASVNVSTTWLDNNGRDVGSYSFHTFIHEIGHALGLGHPGQYDTFADYAREARFSTDSWQQSVMSYFNQHENTLDDGSYAPAGSAMMADVMAIQAIYGAPRGGVTAGDTAWGVGSRFGTYWDGMFAGTAGSLAANCFTIYDEGGRDTLDLSNARQGQRVDLSPGRFSDVFGLRENLGIAHGTTIENAVTGAGADWIKGNAAANALRGGGGRDSLMGLTGADVLEGGDGDDRLSGGDGRDVVRGGAGHDAVGGGASGDRLDGGAGHDNLSGRSGDDSVLGGAGDDVLYGGTGNDRLDGGAGDDVLRGADGRDTFAFSSGRDTVRDFQDDVDTIVLDDALWGGGLSVAEVLGLARAGASGLTLDLGGQALVLDGVRDAAALLDDLVIV